MMMINVRTIRNTCSDNAETNVTISAFFLSDTLPSVTRCPG